VLRYHVKVVRPREHDEHTAVALLDAAEQAIAAQGVDALSLRELTREAGTTTRAVYTLFGSRAGLLAALGVRAFNLLQREIEAMPVTDRPADDLVDVALVFRRFALEHPALFSIAFHRADPAIWPRFRTAALDALAVLHKRFESLDDANLLGARSVSEAAMQFSALCEGIAWTELRGNPLTPDPERFWRSAFHALISGFAVRSATRDARVARHSRPDQRQASTSLADTSNEASAGTPNPIGQETPVP
jgi:AcrR family transcriptional regulator